MENRTRFVNALNFQPVDRRPVIEWAPWWDKTIERWHREGLPEKLTGAYDIREYFQLDPHQHLWVRNKIDGFPYSPEEGQGAITDMESYLKIKRYLYPENPFDTDELAGWGARQKKGQLVILLTLEGFFWFPRTLFGIEDHLYAFADQPEVMHVMNQDLLKYHLRVLDELCRVCRPDLMTFAEDMSYNKGPMISKTLFDEFLAPYYRQIVPRLKEYGIIPFCDSDGNIEPLIPWLLDVGVEGFLPLEHQAGVDIADLRRKFPKLKLLGAFDKMVMNKTEEAMRKEFERILPVMKQGGYVPGVDHQTPPGVSLENYRIYLRLLNEYCRKAV